MSGKGARLRRIEKRRHERRGGLTVEQYIRNGYPPFAYVTDRRKHAERGTTAPTREH